MDAAVRIEVTLDMPKNDSNKHCDITFKLSFDQTPTLGLTADQLEYWYWSVAREGAAQLARIGMFAEPFIRHQRRMHGCRGGHSASSGPMNQPTFGEDACQMHSFDLLEPIFDEAFLSLRVPVNNLKVWKQRVNTWLAALAAAETFKPNDGAP